MIQEFLKLKEYFENLEKEKTVATYEDLPFIGIDWIFSEEIDREIIKEVLADIMRKMNPQYEKYSRKRITLLEDVTTHEGYREFHEPEDIEGFKIILQESENRLIFQAIGADGHTKLSISDRTIQRDNQSEKQVPLITLEEFAEMIAVKLDEIQLEKTLKNLKLDVNTREYFKNKFLNDKQIHLKNLESAKKGLSQLFQNAVKYYRYLVEYNKFLNGNVTTTDISHIIEQRKDDGEARTRKGASANPRVNEIIKFMDRAEILVNLGPAYTRILGEKIEETNEIIANAYTVFIYTNILEETEGEKVEGWLFVCEPQKGDRATRLVFLTKEEFEAFEIGDDEDRLSAISKKYLDKSQTEFDETNGTLILRHTTKENFNTKMRFYIKGEKPTIGNITSYIEYIRRLYNNPKITPKGYKPRHTKTDIRRIVTRISESQVDITAQINEKNPDKLEK